MKISNAGRRRQTSKKVYDDKSLMWLRQTRKQTEKG